MSRMILVPIDISDKEFTERIISHVESEARIDDAEVHFLTVIPSLPYYASLGMAYTAELPGMDELREGSETQLKEIAKQFPSRKTGCIFTSRKDRQKIKSLRWPSRCQPTW